MANCSFTQQPNPTAPTQEKSTKYQPEAPTRVFLWFKLLRAHISTLLPAPPIARLKCLFILSYDAVGESRSRVSPRLGSTAIGCRVSLGEAELRGGMQ